MACGLAYHVQTQILKTMKTLNTQKTKGIKRTVFTLMLAAIVMAGSVSAISSHKRKSVNISESELAEEALKEQRKNEMLLEELSNLYNAQSEEIAELELDVPAYEIYDADDNLIFSGTAAQWENETNVELSKMKRKSDFLFESNGTQVYKVF